MMHSRLTIAGIDVAPHYHPLLVYWYMRIIPTMDARCIYHRYVVLTSNRSFYPTTSAVHTNVRGDSKMYVCAAVVAPAVVLRRKNIDVPVLNDASQIDYCRY